MKFYITLILAFILVCGLSPLAIAQQLENITNPEKNDPIEITAEQVLEWHRNEQQYIARGDAKIKQGTMTIQADIITADYREEKGSGLDIYRLTASGNVIIDSQGNVGRGDKLVYDVAKGVATLTGDDVELASQDQVIKAKESFEYWTAQGRLNAIGNVIVIRKKDTIKADRMSAIFEGGGSDGKRRLKNMEAIDNVVITTEEEILSGNKATYEAASDIALIIGNVEIARGPNVLNGERAEVNLKTNISKLYGQTGGEDAKSSSPSKPGRVRGVFYPESN